jgi:hypothetical protein
VGLRKEELKVANIGKYVEIVTIKGVEKWSSKWGREVKIQ